MALNYTNPGWTNDDEPYIDEDTLNDISDNLEEACDLIGNETMGTTATTITGGIKEIVDEIGNTTMGTAATTVTGAVAELKTRLNQLGSFRCVYIDIGFTYGEPILDKVQRAYSDSAMPKGAPFIAQVASGAQYTMVGYWYPTSQHGYCYIGNFDDFFFVRLDNGVWKITSNEAHTSNTSVTIKIGTGSNYNGTISKSGKLRVYHFFYSVANPVGTISLTTPIGTVDETDKPIYEQTASITAFATGNYAASYAIALLINSNGQIFLRGKTSEIAQCREFRGQLVWTVA